MADRLKAIFFVVRDAQKGRLPSFPTSCPTPRHLTSLRVTPPSEARSKIPTVYNGRSCSTAFPNVGHSNPALSDSSPDSGCHCGAAHGLPKIQKVESPAGARSARDPRTASVRGVNVHAKQKVDGRDRALRRGRASRQPAT